MHLAGYAVLRCNRRLRIVGEEVVLMGVKLGSSSRCPLEAQWQCEKESQKVKQLFGFEPGRLDPKRSVLAIIA